MLRDPFSLENRTILITGASSGLGRAIAIACSHKGAKLVLLGRDKERLEETQQLLLQGCSSFIFTIDLLSEASVLSFGATLRELSLTINGYVHSAGITATLPLKNASAEKWHEIYQVNVVAGMMLANHIAHRQVISKDGASFVFLSSIMGSVGEPGKSIYSASKGALISATKSLALEFSSRNIRVNVLSPGMIETEMVLKGVYRQNEELYEKMKSNYPLGPGYPEDIANATVFLLSDAARWITGTNLMVDGGYTAR